MRVHPLPAFGGMPKTQLGALCLFERGSLTYSRQRLTRFTARQEFLGGSGSRREVLARSTYIGAPENGEVALAQTGFRDALNLNFDLAKEYESLKLAAANGKGIDSFEYADAKSEFILKVVAE